MRHALQVWSEQGHCAAPRDTLVSMAVQILEIPQATIEQAIDAELEAENLIGEGTEDGELLYLTPLYRAETGCMSHLRRLSHGSPPWGALDVAKAIPWAEATTGLTLSESQRAAAVLVLAAKVAIITGGPGVGKTTLVKSLLSILRAKQVKVLLCAPTGRAAKRLTEATGIEAKDRAPAAGIRPEAVAVQAQRRAPARSRSPGDR